MKKALTLIAILCMAALLFVGCDLLPTTPTEPTAPSCEHIWSEATCTSPKTCSDCGATEGEALGHSEETVTGKAATCTEAGLTDGKKCTVCGETTVAQETIPAKGHTEETVAGKNKTCTENGLTDGKKCTVCGETLVAQEEIPAEGHKDGNKDFVCDICKIDLCTDHTEETVAGKAATCTEAGLTDGKKCSVCGDVIVAQETIPAKGHSEETVTGKAATCTEAGLTDGKKCTVCGETTVAQETIPAKGHTEETVAGKAATCTENGLTDGKKCTVCGETTVAQETIPAKGHTEETVAGKAATCTENGLTDGKKCTVCGETTVAQETIPAKGHSFGDNNPTCGACGGENPDYIPPVKIADISVRGEWVDSKVTWNSGGPKDSYDGNVSTKWNPQTKTAYAGEPGIIYILNRAADIQKITITVSGTTHYFDVYTSTDGETYTLLAKVCAENETKAYNGFVCTLDGLNLEGITHVKVMFTGRSNGSTYLNINEVAISEEGSDNLDNSWMIPEEPKEEVKATVEATELVGTFASKGDPSKIYDGNTGTKWNPCVSSYAAGEGIVLHLNDYYDLTKLVFTFSNPHYFKIFVSEDHETYTELATVAEAGQYNEAGTVCTLDGLTAENIKYVKIILTGREGGGTWVNFFEIEMYGTV